MGDDPKPVPGSQSDSVETLSHPRQRRWIAVVREGPEERASGTNTLAIQEQQIRNAAEDESAVIVEVVTEPNELGAGTPAFELFRLHLALREKPDYVVVTSLDQLSPNSGTQVRLIDRILGQEVGFRSLKEDFDTSTPRGRDLLMRLRGLAASKQGDAKG